MLVCDDDTSLLRAVSISLGARGYEVIVARNGEEGIDRTAHRRPDVVLVDLGLPGIDGVEVIRGIRGWSSVPIIVLSARHQSADKVEALDAGADDYVTKPFGMDELLARLRAALRRSGPAGETPMVEAEGFTVDLVEQAGDPGRSRRAPDPEGVGPRRGAGPPPRSTGVAAPAAPRRVGPGLRDRDRVPPGPDGPGPAQARGGPLPAPPLPDRAGHGVPLRALTGRAVGSSAVERATVDIYEDRGLEWAATHATAGRRADAESFATRVAPDAVRLDVGCGAGRYLPHLGTPAIALDASAVMLDACRDRVPGARYVRADVEHLPFARHSIGGAWSWMTHLHVPRRRLPLALWDLHRVLAVGAPFDAAGARRRVRGRCPPR